MDRFIMMKFLQRVCFASEDFIFKGGNLLWFYIKTPRETIDIDFSTCVETDSQKVLETLNSIGHPDEQGLSFKVLGHKVVEENGKVGLALTVAYSIENARNQFGVDIVLGVPTDIAQIQINKQLINAATIENIIVDKVMASHSFGSGNTRAKDYDDLYRISMHADEIDASKVVKIAHIKGVDLSFKEEWISEWTLQAWKCHHQQNRKNDLPTDLAEVF